MKKVAISIVTLFALGASTFAAGAFPENHLKDVTNGAVRGVSTTAETGGFAKTWYNEDGFGLHAGFENLADPIADDFYEGWLVRQNPFDFISTWELVKKEDGYYHDHFESSSDYSDYSFYVLTLEPNDGNPAPAEHIFEGDVLVGDMMKKMDNHVKSVTIDLTGENFRFSQDEIRVKKWQEVTINFASTGGFHDWVVDEFDAATSKVSEWETTSVTFTADTVGEFEYYCSVGNHRAEWMIGKLIVEDVKSMNHTMMKEDKMMMERTMTNKQKALKKAVMQKLETIDIPSDILLERVMNFDAELDSLNISASKKAAYQEILFVLIEVLKENVMMGK